MAPATPCSPKVKGPYKAKTRSQALTPSPSESSADPGFSGASRRKGLQASALTTFQKKGPSLFGLLPLTGLGLFDLSVYTILDYIVLYYTILYYIT